MNKFRELLKSNYFKIFLTVLKVFLMVMALYLYLMYADLSTAPAFIYNQF